MKRNLALLSSAALAIVLVGCSSEQAPSRDEACADLGATYSAALDSIELGLSASTPDALGVHLDAIEDAIAKSGEVAGPSEFVEVRDDLLSDTQAFVDEGRAALDGDASGLDQAQSRMLESYNAVNRYCGAS